MRSAPSSWLTTGTALAVLAIPIPATASELNLIPDAGIVATNVALFLLLIYPVNRLLVQPLLRALDEREARTSGALEQSLKLGAEARATGIDLESRLSEARARAQSQRSTILSDGEIQERAVIDAAREEASGIIESVRQSVRSELIEARKGLQTESRALAREAATRILGRAL